jgi:hypothetical protein
MRSFSIAAVVIIALATACVDRSYSAGTYVVGKEECNCSPLIARGIIPDPLNKLSEALLLPQVAMVLDKIVVGIKDMMGQFGPTPAEVSEEAVKQGEAAPELNEEPGPGKTPQKEEKPAIEKKPIKKKKSAVHLKKYQKKKHRRVKLPPKVT